jgi:hypothetical protein
MAPSLRAFPPQRRCLNITGGAALTPLGLDQRQELYALYKEPMSAASASTYHLSQTRSSARQTEHT